MKRVLSVGGYLGLAVVVFFLGMTILFPVNATVGPKAVPSEPVMERVMEVAEVREDAAGISLSLEEDVAFGAPSEEVMSAIRLAANEMKFEEYRRDRLIIGTYATERLVATFSLQSALYIPAAGDFATLRVYENGCAHISFSRANLREGCELVYVLCSNSCEECSMLEKEEVKPLLTFMPNLNVRFVRLVAELLTAEK